VRLALTVLARALKISLARTPVPTPPRSSVTGSFGSGRSEPVSHKPSPAGRQRTFVQPAGTKSLVVSGVLIGRGLSEA